MTTASVQLLWLPLGAGGRSVQWNGRVVEAVAARLQRRTPCQLLHAALEVRRGVDRWTLEMTPAWGAGSSPGLVSGPVGLQVLGRSVLFRYAVRLSADGTIPDIAEAVGPPTFVATDEARVRRLLADAAWVPSLTWGRDELGLGDIWTSNSVVSWLLVTSGHDLDTLHVPPGARAPGWAAGRRLAASARVQDRGELLDAVDQAGAGSGPGGVGVDGVHGHAHRQHP